MGVKSIVIPILGCYTISIPNLRRNIMKTKKLIVTLLIASSLSIMVGTSFATTRVSLSIRINNGSLYPISIHSKNDANWKLDGFGRMHATRIDPGVTSKLTITCAYDHHDTNSSNRCNTSALNLKDIFDDIAYDVDTHTGMPVSYYVPEQYIYYINDLKYSLLPMITIENFSNNYN